MIYTHSAYTWQWSSRLPGLMQDAAQRYGGDGDEQYGNGASERITAGMAGDQSFAYRAGKGCFLYPGAG
ncbi:hypothetical protein YWY31_27440 [Paenibacillus illinoisensis]